MRPELSQLPTITPSFYGYDGGGSVRALANAAGAVTDTYEYDGFGNGVSTSGSTPNNYLYRGEQYDPDLGLYYLRARYYNPLTGRFMSRDPEDPKPIDPSQYQPFQSNRKPTDPKELHKYLYAGGDPVNRFDPRGREEEEYSFQSFRAWIQAEGLHFAYTRAVALAVCSATAELWSAENPEANGLEVSAFYVNCVKALTAWLN